MTPRNRVIPSSAAVIPFKPSAGRIMIGPPGMNGSMDVTYFPPPDSPRRGHKGCTHHIGSYLSRDEARAVARVFVPKLEFIFGEEVIVHVEGQS